MIDPNLRYGQGEQPRHGPELPSQVYSDEIPSDARITGSRSRKRARNEDSTLTLMQLERPLAPRPPRPVSFQMAFSPQESGFPALNPAARYSPIASPARGHHQQSPPLQERRAKRRRLKSPVQSSDHQHPSPLPAAHLLALPGIPSPEPRPLRRTRFTPPVDEKIIKLKEEFGLKWDDIKLWFPGRNAQTLQVRYCKHLKPKNEEWTDQDVRMSCGSNSRPFAVRKHS